jgi:hypothetical protein
LLAQGKVSLVSVKRVQVERVDINLAGQSFKAAKLQVIQPRALVDRDADKRWMLALAGREQVCNARTTAHH